MILNKDQKLNNDETQITNWTLIPKLSPKFQVQLNHIFKINVWTWCSYIKLKSTVAILQFTWRGSVFGRILSLSQIKLGLCHNSKNRIMPTDAWTTLFIFLLRMANTIKLRLQKTFNTSIIYLNIKERDIKWNDNHHTEEASMLPPNHTAKRCMWWETTSTSIGFGYQPSIQ